ncbi:MAG: hypothetical protein R3B49_04385 [Phycisphaerales bacterium]
MRTLVERGSRQPGTPARAGASASGRIDELMERASASLEETRYFEASGLCRQALVLARRASDYERMARITMPLLEARRQIRQLAESSGPVRVVRATEDVPRPLEAGRYLLQPPMIGMDGRRLHELGDEHEVPVFALVREPLTRDGLWPIVGVGDVVVRTKVDPAAPAKFDPKSPARDKWSGEVPGAWFTAAAEALGDAVIRDAERVSEGDPAAFLVDDLLERLAIAPEHEKVYQRLERACRDAMREPTPTEVRRRPSIHDPFSF